jgi:hypothetical protein
MFVLEQVALYGSVPKIIYTNSMFTNSMFVNSMFTASELYSSLEPIEKNMKTTDKETFRWAVGQRGCF